MSPALEKLCAALAPLRLYKLRQDSLVDRELAAYAAAFAVAERLLAEAGDAAFVQTAGAEVIARYEELVGLAPRDGLDIETRRQLVLYRLGAAPLDFTRQGMTNSIRATGMEAALEEDPQRESMTVRCLQVLDASLDLDGMKNSVRAVLPAHLECEFDLGELTWDVFEERGVDWERWDAVGMTWGDFDLNGHNLF